MRLWVQLISRLKQESLGFRKSLVEGRMEGKNKTEEAKEAPSSKPSRKTRSLRKSKKAVKDPSSVTSHAQSDSSYSQ